MQNVGVKTRKRFDINAVVQFLTYSDILMMSGWGLVLPIISVFFSDQIVGGNVKFAGLASTVYFIIKSVVQIPVARMVDKHRGEKDDFWVMVAGSVLISLSAFLYMFATTKAHVYGIQVLYGIGGALSYPTWLAIFTRHVDKNKEGLEWSLYYTSVDVGSALTAGLGGLLAASFGYQFLFWLVGVSSIAGTMFLIGIREEMKKR